MHMRKGVVFTWLGVGLLMAALLAPAPAAAQAPTWLPGPGAILDPTYDGFIDLPANAATVPNGGFTVAGWFVDKTAQGWAGADDVQVWQGTMDGGKMLAKASFAQNRPDVGAAEGNPFYSASGFSTSIPAGSLGTGNQTLSVYVHTAGKGWWYKQVTANVSGSAPAAASPSAPAPAAATAGSALPILGFVKPTDGEKVLTKDDYEIIGFALDRAAQPNQGVAGSGINRVQVYVGAREDNGVFLGEADLGFSDATAASYGQQFASAGWRIHFKPTQFHANTYLLYAYARSAVTGKEESTQRFFAIRES
jgi:hypothetical protein